MKPDDFTRPRVDEQHALPYVGVKPTGSADFYFAINATFRFVLEKCGLDGLRRYWSEMGASYYAPVSDSWRRGGLNRVADYWRAFFDAEPDADVRVKRRVDQVELDVKECPAIRHLRKHKREIVPCYCQHCYYVSDAMARPAGLTVRIEGGDGTCRQSFVSLGTQVAPQDLSLIAEVR